MKKLIPLLVICLTILCFFSSCGMLDKLVVDGTWTFDLNEGRNYNTYKLIFSEGQVQIIKYQYGLSGHRFLKSTDVSEPMPYTVGKDGVMTLNYSVGVMNVIDITDTFTLDNIESKLIWKQGYFETEYALEKESIETTFITPARGYERYLCDVVSYWEPGEEVSIEGSNLFLYSDGQYSWEGDGRTVSSGRWTKSETEPNKLSLIASDGWNFTRMDLEYIVDSSTASHLKTNSIENDNLDMFTGFSYDFAWNIEFYR